MTTKLRHRNGTLLLLYVLFYIQAVSFIAVSAHHSSHKSGHNHEDFHHRREINASSTSPGEKSLIQTLEDARTTIEGAMKAVAAANKLRLDNPQFNVYTFRNASDSFQGNKLASPLVYEQNDTYSTNITNIQHHVSHRSTENSSLSVGMLSEGHAYSIPDELARAARMVAESAVFDIPSLVNTASTRPLPGTNDTNAMSQALVRPDGLHGWASEMNPSLGQLQNQTASNLDKRATSSFWMANMQQNGVSPFAPSGYKVWRNVKDFGAKGDGITDDTVAINKAISDGGRCGINCGSSTIFPAVVYFPPGTYLVSTSIIQYYNTQILGDPTKLPTILAAPSFIGLGVITSDVYIGEQEGWYLNTNNFLRSVRNLNIDITLTRLDAYVCGIHWQVAQGTSLENINFYSSSKAGSTQQGIYMENGSGGWLSDLTFYGGRFGAYLGNQQFTSRNLVFKSCLTALQVHWDWAWTMQGVDIQSCGTAIVIVGGAGGPLSTGQGVGSMVLMDLSIQNTPVGIQTSLFKENSTALMLHNAYFFNVEKAVTESVLGSVLLAGSSGAVQVDSWGFGLITNSSGKSSFANAGSIPSMIRTASLLEKSGTHGGPQPKFFTRRKPQYLDIGSTQILDVTQLGARGDGKTDNTAVLNSIFAIAANMSSIVFIPFGVYKITDTVRIPVGCRIIGQAWSQIMATGSKFNDASNPRIAVQVGSIGDIGVIEIQDLMFTVSGPTAGAILVQWNVHEISQGSVGLWDTHIRVGGAIGSGLQKAQCPKLTGKINPNCIAASLLFHMTAASSAYLENTWFWVADHDMDIITQDEIDIYSARGLLIESKGPTWLYGTAVEHNVLYQYQLSGVKDIFLGMIQTESPYFQVAPAAPAPFKIGGFPNDPTFEDCKAGSLGCAVSWAIRILDSSTVYLLGAGLYSFFQKYEQKCLSTESCQDRAFVVEQSSDIWIYNLVTKGIVEMISPHNAVPTYAKANKNGYASSILAWLEGATQTSGARSFLGFQLYDHEWLSTLHIPDKCVTALAASIYCDDFLATTVTTGWRGSLDNATLTDSVCDAGCGASLSSYFHTVESACTGYNITGAPPTLLGGNVWAGYNETCTKDSATGKYCNDIISGFTLVPDYKLMPRAELCSECYSKRLAMMQATQFSSYDVKYSEILAFVKLTCALAGPTSVLPPLILPEATPVPFCASGKHYTTVSGDTCDSIALSNSLSSASLFMGNTELRNCSQIKTGISLCLPFSCQFTYQLQPNDTCITMMMQYDLGFAGLRGYNSWIYFDCSNLQQSSETYGKILCLSPQGGIYDKTALMGGNRPNPHEEQEYANNIIPPRTYQIVATGTTKRCGRWHTAVAGDDCAEICIQSGITSSLFLAINPSLSKTSCNSDLKAGLSYCVGPVLAWNTSEDSLPPPPAGPEVSAAATSSYWASVLSASGILPISKTATTTMLSSTSISKPSTTTSMTTTISSTPRPLTYPYIGCYSDVATSRTLGSANLANTHTMTLERCAAFCAPQYSMYGLEFGSECWCGNILGAKAAPAAEADCNMPCEASASQKCGGSDRISIYAKDGVAPKAYSYAGCYTDKASSRALGADTRQNTGVMTYEYCANFCTPRFALYGLEYGSECWCANLIGLQSTKVADKECNMACQSDASKTCGGPDRITVFGQGGVALQKSGPAALPRVGDYKYIGCYTDISTARVLPGPLIQGSSDMTAAKCISLCGPKYKMFGMENGGDCYCGDTLSAQSKLVAASECSSVCRGDSSQLCGAFDRLTIYLKD